MSSSKSVVDAAGPTGSTPREPAIDVVFKLGARRYRTRQQLPLGGPPSMSSSNSVVNAAGPASNAPQGGRHRRHLQTQWSTLPNLLVAPPGARHQRRLQPRWWTLPDPPAAAPGGSPSTSSSNLVVDAAGPSGSTTSGPAINIIFKLSGGRCRTHQHRPLGGLPSTSSSNSIMDTARPVSSATQGGGIDVVFKLGGGSCRT
jgi:hypothetical protein